MNNAKKLLALLLALVMVLGLVACGGAKTEEPKAEEPKAEAPAEAPAAEEVDTPLVVGYSPFSSKFSPFFAESGYDQDVADMTQLGLLASDRQGAIIYKGIEGETINYNGTDYTYYGPANLTITENEDGTVYYDFQLREDLVFADGQPMTIDDVIFSMYVYADPTYDGSTTFFALPIEGIEAYRSGMEARMNLILADGRAEYAENEYYTQEQYDIFWAAFDAAGVEFVKGIKDALVNTYGYNTEEDPVAVWAANWGYTLAEDATEEDFWAEIVATYGYDISDSGINYEAGSASITACLETVLGDDYGQFSAGVQTGESAPSITGIQKTGENSVRVVLTQVDATAIYQLGLAISPMHYYGDPALYDYENNSFGFPKGDLSSIRAKTTQPMGAGPYKFVKFENGVVSFEANENYFKGAPKTRYINFLETQEPQKLNGIITGTLDITDPSFSADVIKAIHKANGVEDIVGPVVTTNTVDNLGYGYVGMNAQVMSVGGEPGSDASKALRKAFGTIFSVYRDVSVDTYYGEMAAVINYPISNTSWAAPQSTDDGYRLAFSVDAEGNDIYTSDMTAEERYEAALTAALGFFEAAGYTVEDGKLTAAPEGASLEYELWIPGDGASDHPSFMMCTMARDALATIGMNLIVTDLTDSSELWTALEAQQLAMWCAAWQATVDPDMYQIYFSGDGERAEGGSNYMYSINDAELNQLVLDARMSLDQTFRKAMYKACLDIVIDWAVEIPVYQRQNAITFSTERVNMETVTPDITTFYGWMAEVENIELN